MVRPFNHAGPRQSPRYVLAGLALQVAEVERGRRECLEVGNLDVIRDFIDVRDVVRAYRLSGINTDSLVRSTTLAAAKAQKSPMRSNTFALRLQRLSRSVSTAARVRPVDQPLLVADASKLRAAVGWEPRYTIEQTLADMLEFSRTMVAACTT